MAEHMCFMCIIAGSAGESHVREGKFELDSLMNFLRLSRSYFTAVVNSSAAVTLSPFDSTWLLAVNKTLEVVVNMSRSFDEQYMQLNSFTFDFQ